MSDICSYKNICIYSSLFFVITAIVAFINKNYIFGVIALFLTITSLIVHSCSTNYTFFIDKISIYMIVIYSFYFLYKKCSIKKINLRLIILLCFIFATFFISIYLYYYGYYSNQFSFDKDINIARLHHFYLHFISAYGLTFLNIM
jgi:hypothetical protein